MQAQRPLRRTITWAAALFILITGMSCSLFSGRSTGGSPDSGSPNNAETPYVMPTAEGTVDIDLGLATLESYHAHLTIAFRGDDTPAGKTDASADFTVEMDRAGDAYYEDAYLVANPANPPVGEVLWEIGNKQYMLTWSDLYRGEKTGCMVTPYQKDPHLVHTGFSNYIREIKKDQLVARGEMVNGIKADHYTVSGVDFIQAKNETVSGDVWVAQDGGYVVKAAGTVEADLDDERKIHGKGEWAFDLQGVNSTKIALDPICEQTGSPDFPMVPDAANVSASGGFFSYSTQMPAKDVAEFYKTALPPLGYAFDEKGGNMGDETRYMWSLKKGEQNFMLDIMQSNGMTLVNVVTLK